MTKPLTMSDLYSARATLAKVVMLHGERYLPLFERIDREIAEREARQEALARVAQFGTETRLYG